MKTFAKTLVGVISIPVGILIVLVLVAWPQQCARDGKFKAQVLLPIASHVRAVQKETGKLPSEQELQKWLDAKFENKAVWYYTNRPSFMSEWGVDGVDFVVGAWRGERTEYYKSWDSKTFSRNPEN